MSLSYFFSFELVYARKLAEIQMLFLYSLDYINRRWDGHWAEEIDNFSQACLYPA